jgi:hypothetical protein
MRIRRLVAGAVIAATAVVPLAAASTAGASYRPPAPTTKAHVIPIVRLDRHDPSVAHVYATYRCTVADPVNNPGELWVSVKQSDSGRYDPAIAAEGSGFGGVAARWEDSHRNPVNCDGRTHVAAFTVDQIEGKQAYKTLKRGLAYVQFCLFDDTTPKGNGTTDFGVPVSSFVWSLAI